MILINLKFYNKKLKNSIMKIMLPRHINLYYLLFLRPFQRQLKKILSKKIKNHKYLIFS